MEIALKPEWAPRGAGWPLGAASVSPATRSTGVDVWVARLDAPGEKRRPYLQSAANEAWPSLSPVNDRIAYASDETRRFEVYVQSFPNPGRKQQVSLNGGELPVWGRDGKELFFVGLDGKMMAAGVRRNGEDLEIDTPKPIFDVPMSTSTFNSFDVAKDGRFLIPAQEPAGRLPLTLVLN